MKSNPCRRCKEALVYRNRHLPSYLKKCVDCEKIKSHKKYLETQRKYAEGEVIKNFEELDNYNGWVIWHGRTTHVSVIKNQQFHYISYLIRNGNIRKAVKKEVIIEEVEEDNGKKNS